MLHLAQSLKKFQRTGFASVVTFGLIASLLMGQSVSNAAVRPHVAFSATVDTRYDHSVRVTISGLAASGTTTYTLICDGTHTSGSECSGGAQGVYTTFKKNGSNQWVNTGTNYYATVAKPILWFAGLANNQSYTLTFTQNSVTSTPVTFTTASSVGGPTNVTMSMQSTPETSVPVICVDFCESGTSSTRNAYAAGSSVTVSWTKPETGLVEAGNGLYGSDMTPEGYIVTVLPSRLEPFLHGDNRSLATNTYTASNAYITLSNGTLLYDGCSASDTSRNGNFNQNSAAATNKMGAIGAGWFVAGFDTTSVVLKGCHFARDESYIAYVEPYYASGMGTIWNSLDPNTVPYGWDPENGVTPFYEVFQGNIDTARGGGGGLETMLAGTEPWQTGASAAMPADNAPGNLIAMAAPVLNVVAQPASTTDPSLKGSLRVSWSANQADLFYGTPDSNLAMSPITQYRVTLLRGSVDSWEAQAGLFHLNSTATKTTCVTTATTCVLTGMSEWTRYKVHVQAENAASRSTILSTPNAQTNWPLSPSEPLNPTASSTDGSTSTISWTPPASFGGPSGATVTKYTAFMYPTMKTVINDCAGTFPSTELDVSAQLFQLQTTTKEIIGSLFNSTMQFSSVTPKLTYFQRNANGTVSCLGSVSFRSLSDTGFSTFNPTTNGYIAMFADTAYWYPKIADDDSRLTTFYGQQSQGNITYRGSLTAQLPFLLYPGGPDFANGVFLGNSSSAAWAASGAVLKDVRQVSSNGTSFLALVGTDATFNNSSSKWYRITVSGGTVTRSNTPVISLGCRNVPSQFCSTTVQPPTVIDEISSVAAFDINPISKNIYFIDPTTQLSGMYTSQYINGRMYRMAYDENSDTWGAPTLVTFNTVKTPTIRFSGQFPIRFDENGRAYATSYSLGSYIPGALFTESAGGFTMVSGTNLLNTTPYRSPAFPVSAASSYIPQMIIRTTFGHAFGYDPYVSATNTTLYRLTYTGDVNLHVCTSTDGPPATPSCTVGSGSDPNPIVPGTVYSYDVTATNTSPDGSLKNGPLSKVGTFMAGGPAAPTLTNLQLGGTLASPTAMATFRPSVTAPSVVDESITTYTCTLYSATGTALATKTVTPPSPITLTTDLTCTFSAADGVANSTSYQVGITATNSVGTSGPATAPFLIVGSPTAPSPVRGSTSGNVTTVTYTPNKTGTQSVLIIDPDTGAEVLGATCVGATINNPSCTVNDLIPGKTYTLKACTSNVYSASPACTTTSYTVPVAIPSAPVVTTSPNNGTIDVSWPTPPNNGSVITGYTVTVSPGGGSGCTSLGASATSCKLTGLTNGTTYVIEVAVNYTTNGVAGTTKVATTVSDVPFVAPAVAPAPTAVSNASGVATVTYDPTDDNNNGTTIDSYTFYAYDTSGNRVSPELSCTAIAPATSCDINGLTDGVTYKFGVVKNYQAPGGGFTSSTVSPLSNEVTPVGVVYVPSPPLNVTVDPADHAATVSWTAPTSNGGAPIISYTVQAYDSHGNAVSGATCTVNAPGLSCTVEGLSLGADYTFKVVATNVAGDSDPSQPSDSMSPTGIDPVVPGSVLNGAATSGDAEITVTWDAPNTGDVPTSYEVSIPGQPTCVIDLVANPSAALSCTFAGLTNGTNYTATIVAKNSVGAGDATTVSATPYGAPSAPGISSAIATSSGDGAVVTVTPPSSNGGSPVTSYTIYAYNSNGMQVGSCTTSGTSCTITGLTKGVTYTFRAVATTSRGMSSPSASKSLLIPDGYKKVNAYIRGWSYQQRDITDQMKKEIRAAARLIVAGNNKNVIATGFANFTAKVSLSRDRAINVAAYLREYLNQIGGSAITIRTVTGGNTTKFGGTVLNRVVVLQGR